MSVNGQRSLVVIVVNADVSWLIARLIERSAGSASL